jgi:hypothetical protein
LDFKHSPHITKSVFENPSDAPTTNYEAPRVADLHHWYVCAVLDWITIASLKVMSVAETGLW